MVLFGAFDADQKFRKITFVSVHAGVAHQVVNVQISDGLKVTSFKKLQEVFRVFNLRLQRTAHDIAGIQAGMTARRDFGVAPVAVLKAALSTMRPASRSASDTVTPYGARG